MEILFVVAALITGGAIAFVFTWYYQGRANRRLKVEMDKLKNLNFLILERLENAGLLKWSHDKEGNLIGLDLDLDEDLTTDEQEVGDKTIH